MADIEGPTAINLSELVSNLPELPKAKKVVIDEFIIHRTIGTGSFGRVHLVKEKTNGKYWAMKALKKNEIVRNRQIEHTVNEKHILEMLDHPFIVRLFGTFQDSQYVFLILEYIQGGELFTFLRRSGVRFHVLSFNH